MPWLRGLSHSHTTPIQGGTGGLPASVSGPRTGRSRPRRDQCHPRIQRGGSLNHPLPLRESLAPAKLCESASSERSEGIKGWVFLSSLLIRLRIKYFYPHGNNPLTTPFGSDRFLMSNGWAGADSNTQPSSFLSSRAIQHADLGSTEPCGTVGVLTHCPSMVGFKFAVLRADREGTRSWKPDNTTPSIGSRATLRASRIVARTGLIQGNLPAQLLAFSSSTPFFKETVL